MQKNKTIQLRIPQELHNQIKAVTKNTSEFIREATREKLETIPDRPKDRKNFEIRSRTPYLYYAELISVIDGDTLRLKIDMGFFTTIQEKIRLAGINTPPINTPEGQAASDFVRMEITGANLLIETRKKEKFGRYLAYVYYSRRHTKFEDIIREGKLLNDELINKGHAEKY